MPWSNLSLAESKYKIYIARSKAWQYCLIVEFICAAIGIFYLLENFPLVIRIISLVMLLVVLVYWQRKSSAPSHITFEVDLLGHCQWPNLAQCQLSTQSKVAWWGCYLYFQPPLKLPSVVNDISSNNAISEKSASKNANSKKDKPNSFSYPYSLIVIKDSINDRDYARLCRIINKVKQTDLL